MCKFITLTKGSRCKLCGYILKRDYDSQPDRKCNNSATQKGSYMSLLSQYLEERQQWKSFGSPYRNKEEMSRIFKICAGCEEYIKKTENSGKCNICKCNLKKDSLLLNKIAWATTKCPKYQPEWIEDLGSIARAKMKKEAPAKVETSEEPKPQRRRCCGG